LNKVGGSDAKDNCKREFNYAARLLSSSKMIPVVMEEQVSNPNSWTGPVGMELGGILYVRMWDDDDQGLEHLIREIVQRTPAWSTHLKELAAASSMAVEPVATVKAVVDADPVTLRERTLHEATQAATAATSAAHQADLAASRASLSNTSLHVDPHPTHTLLAC
jgi:hypothetical protein